MRKFLVRVLAAAAVLCAGLAWSGHVDAEDECKYGVVIDGECVPNAPDGMIVARQSEDEPPPPDRTITDGQSTTITARLPANLYQVQGGACGTGGGRLDPDSTTSTGWCGGRADRGGGGTQYDECLGPYTVVLFERYDSTGDYKNAADDWVTTDGLRITVNTADTGLTDSTGTYDIGYFLRGRRTVTIYPDGGGAAVAETVDCSLQVSSPMRVAVRVAAGRGMTRTVSEYAPPQEWIDLGPQRTTWHCEQDDIDEGYPCTVGDEITTVFPREFPTPRGCVIVVLGDDQGYGSTGCVSRDEAQTILDIQEGVKYDENGDLVSGTPVDFDDLDRCVEGERPADGERCVARN